MDSVKRSDFVATKAALDAGAEVNIRSEWKHTPLHYAAENGDCRIVKIWLDKGADVNAKDAWHYTPLHWAVLRNKLEAVALLVAHGGDIAARNDLNDTPLTLATKKGWIELVRRMEEEASEEKPENANGVKKRSGPGTPGAKKGLTR